MHPVTPSAGLLLVYLAAFPCVLFGAFWVVGHVFAALSGWSALASRYACDAEIAGATVDVHSGRLGLVGYGGVLTVTASQRGLHLDVAFIPGHPAVLVPWNDIGITLPTTFGHTRINVMFTKLQGLTLALGGGGVSLISRYALEPHPPPQLDDVQPGS